jgi:hypothetical protein
MDCTVENVLYVLVCNGCKEFYIGQTGDKLRNRKNVHARERERERDRERERERDLYKYMVTSQ